MEELQDALNHQTVDQRVLDLKDDDLDLMNAEQFIEQPIYFEPENEKGSIEYKAKLCNINQNRFQHLSTQMKWRMQNGNGECIYRIGVADNGLVVGLTRSQAESTLKTVEKMAKKLNASIRIFNEIEVKEKNKTKLRYAYELSVKELNNKAILPELRIALLGNLNSGKTSLISILTQGK